MAAKSATKTMAPLLQAPMKMDFDGSFTHDGCDNLDLKV